MADVATTIQEFFSSITGNPLLLLLVLGLLALLMIAVVAHHIHKIHSQEIFVHQAWGANWKGR